MNDIKLTLEVEVNPTEDPEKVEHAIQNLFSCSFKESIPRHLNSLLIMKGEGKEALNLFYDRLRQERILSAARRVMIDGLKGNSIIFYLNKQASYMNRISFSSQTGEAPLGTIRVEINCNNTKELIDWLTPNVIFSRNTRGMRINSSE